MRKQDRLVFEDMRQKMNFFEKKLEDFGRELKNQELEILYLRNLVEEQRAKKREGKLKAVQVPPDRAEELRQEREAKKRKETTLPG